jgi:hypothetical protein
MLEFPIDRILNEALESEAVLGGEEERDEFVVRCAKEPIGLRLRHIFEQLGKPLPADYALYKAFDVWLIPHRVSILRRRGLAEPVSVGISVEYVHGEKTCSIVSLIPEQQFIRRGQIATEIGIKGRLSISGEAQPSEDTANLDPHIPAGTLQFGLTAGGEVGFQLSASVCSPIVAAVGKGNSRCEWVFHKQDVPLHDRDLETWSVVVLPKRQTDLVYRLKLYYTTRTLFFPTRRESDLQKIRCQLAG